MSSLLVKCGTASNAVPTLLMKCGTSGTAVPTLLMSCVERVPSTSCGGCSPFPSIVYLTATVPNNSVRVCIDGECFSVTTSGERLAYTVMNPGSGDPCFFFRGQYQNPVPNDWISVWWDFHGGLSLGGEHSLNFLSDGLRSIGIAGAGGPSLELYPYLGTWQSTVTPFCGPSVETHDMMLRWNKSGGGFVDITTVTLTIELPDVVL